MKMMLIRRDHLKRSLVKAAATVNVIRHSYPFAIVSIVREIKVLLGLQAATLDAIEMDEVELRRRRGTCPRFRRGSLTSPPMRFLKIFELSTHTKMSGSLNVCTARVYTSEAHIIDEVYYVSTWCASYRQEPCNSRPSERHCRQVCRCSFPYKEAANENEHVTVRYRLRSF